MELSYNGKYYHGWQVQPNAMSVQEVVENALSTLIANDIVLIGAGRTDTGVHASHFVAHFDVQTGLDDPDNLVYRLNRFGMKGIRIYKIQKVNNELHSRFSAVSRTYHYIISLNNSPFLEDFSWYCGREPDMQIMNEACKALMQYRDFTSFARLHADTASMPVVVV